MDDVGGDSLGAQAARPLPDVLFVRAVEARGRPQPERPLRGDRREPRQPSVGRQDLFHRPGDEEVIEDAAGHLETPRAIRARSQMACDPGRRVDEDPVPPRRHDEGDVLVRGFGARPGRVVLPDRDGPPSFVERRELFAEPIPVIGGIQQQRLHAPHNPARGHAVGSFDVESRRRSEDLALQVQVVADLARQQASVPSPKLNVPRIARDLDVEVLQAHAKTVRRFAHLQTNRGLGLGVHVGEPGPGREGPGGEPAANDVARPRRHGDRRAADPPGDAGDDEIVPGRPPGHRALDGPRGNRAAHLRGVSDAPGRLGCLKKRRKH